MSTHLQSFCLTYYMHSAYQATRSYHSSKLYIQTLYLSYEAKGHYNITQ